MITQQRLKEIAILVDGVFYRAVSRGRGSGKRWVQGTRIGYISGGYDQCSIDYQRYKVHRLVWMWHYGEFPNGHIDHIDGNKLNNKIENLREATDAQNVQNQRKARASNKLGIQGVCKQNNKYRASIHLNYKKIHLGYFDTPEKAHQKYLDAKRKLHEYGTI
jgi:hypothetical protein